MPELQLFYWNALSVRRHCLCEAPPPAPPPKRGRHSSFPRPAELGLVEDTSSVLLVSRVLPALQSVTRHGPRQFWPEYSDDWLRAAPPKPICILLPNESS